MPPTKTLAVLGLTLLLLTAGCLGAVTGTNDASVAGDGATDDRTIQVGASGQASAEPDQAVLRLSVVATGDDAETARKRLAENVTRLREALRDAGVDDGQVATVRYDIDENYRHERDDSAPAYRAMQSFAVTLDDTERVGPVIDAAVANGATGVDRVRFTLSTEQRRQLQHEALADAMGAARGKADVLADSAGLAITGVGAVETAPSRHRYVVETAAAGDAGGSSVESGPVTVTVQVRVTYNATSADE